MQATNKSSITEDVCRIADEEPLDYQARKERGVCTYPGCPEPAREDAGTCEKHGERKARTKRRLRKRRKKLAKILLARRIAKKQCVRCGGKRLSGEEHCANCLLAVGDIATKAQLVRGKARGKKAERIEINTSIDKDGRSRYRGQGKRGRQSVAAVDATDLAYASDAMKRGVDGLAYSRSSTVAQLPRIQREDLKKASLAELLLARRFLDDVLARHRVIAPPAVEDED